ncbi:MAG: RagB/SusD family nutrient uptake outer membrane protein [Bacteroidota bacterium]
MKHIFRHLLLVGAFGILLSCNDAIDIIQPGRLGAEDAFQSLADLESGLLGTLATIDNTTQIQFNSVFTDEIGIGPDNGGQGLNDGSYGFILNAGSDAPLGLWLKLYSTLNSANRLIAAIETVEVAPEEQARENEILGQALAIRAFTHFEILTYFSTDYTDDSALAGFLVDFVPTIDQQLDRATNGEFFSLIDSDLSRAEQLITTQSNPQNISLDFVRFLRIKIDVYRQNYGQVDARAAALLADYPLANRAEYEDIFFDLGETEIIFELLRVINGPYDRQGDTGSAFATGWVGANYAFVDATIGGAPYFDIGRSLFDVLDPADVRYDVIVGETSLISPNPAAESDFVNNDVLLVSKYEGKVGQPLLNDLKLCRSSELVLFRAEAAAANNDLQGAATFLKTLRDVRFGADTPLPNFGSAQEAFGAIVDERRIEFAFEGYRWVDLKRLGERGNRGILRSDLDCAVNDACALPATDFRFTMPIPLNELNANPDVQQNPGY